MPEYAAVTELDDLERLVLACRRCDLRQGCKQVVFGEGNPRASLMLVGEGPGAVEDELGRPFVGPAGKLLDRILEAAGFSRGEVYIANVVKCRPPGNRLPTAEEAARCFPNLRAQIRIISPRIIVCLGALATQTLVDGKAKITTARGVWYDRNGVKIIPTFHPAALLRDESKKRPVWEDFKKIRAVYDSLPGGA
ncbi:MAG: uracil-DNA glycosylase [Firmicutes bacterium]|nr:uracil-DNA glycosylase [Bacillota bacterium]